MQFHTFDRANGYEILECVDFDDRFDTVLALDGSSRAENWKPFRVRRLGIARKRPARASDSPYEGDHAMFFRRSAVDALRNILEAHGELLPLEDEGGVELYLYNPRALDALDQVHTPGWRDEDGKVTSSSRPVFIPSIVENVDIFKVAAPRAGTIYVSERFVARWKEAKLEGLEFKIAWDSDWPLPEPEPPPVKKPPTPEYLEMIAYLQGLEPIQRLKAMQEQAKNNFATIKASTENQVVRWEWASDTLHSYEPAYFEINKYPRGKVLASADDALMPPYQYGYDAQGRVIVERQYNEFPGHMCETFFRHEPDGILVIMYDHYIPDKDLLALQWFTLSEGRVVALHKLNFEETYQYDEQGRMVRLDRRGLNGNGTLTDWYELEYDTKGKIMRIHWCYPDGSRHLHYQRAARKNTLTARKNELLEGLTAAIIEGLRKLQITDEVYVLAIRYEHDESDLEHKLPPIVALNTVPERERLMREQGDEGYEASWNPCEWRQDFGELSYDLSPDLAALCAVVNQDIWQHERQKETFKFFFELLHSLYHADLPIRRFEDLVGVVLVMGADELAEQVSEQLPAPARKSLQKAGWLPR